MPLSGKIWNIDSKIRANLYEDIMKNIRNIYNLYAYVNDFVTKLCYIV